LSLFLSFSLSSLFPSFSFLFFPFPPAYFNDPQTNEYFSKQEKHYEVDGKRGERGGALEVLFTFKSLLVNHRAVVPLGRLPPALVAFHQVVAIGLIIIAVIIVTAQHAIILHRLFV
jgi:hypothetical protein